MKALFSLTLALVLISFGFACSASEFQEFVQLSGDMHSVVYIPNIVDRTGHAVAGDKTTNAETRGSDNAVRADYSSRFPFGDPGFHEIPDYIVAGDKTTGAEKRSARLIVHDLYYIPNLQEP
jgi:hypothetical protein